MKREADFVPAMLGRQGPIFGLSRRAKNAFWNK
jgi:hypothetical protein